MNCGDYTIKINWSAVGVLVISFIIGYFLGVVTHPYGG